MRYEFKLVEDKTIITFKGMIGMSYQWSALLM